MKRTTVLILAFATVFAMLISACTQTPTATPAASPSAASTPTPSSASTPASQPEAPEKEILKFSVAIDAPETDMFGTPTYAAWKEACEALLGVILEIDYNLIPGVDYDAKINVMIASNELPDVYKLPFLFDFNKYAEEGFYLDLLAYYDMPVYMELVDKSIEGRAKAIRDDGTMPVLFDVGMPLVEEGKMPTFMLSPCWNYTAFQRDGIKIPDTFDEMYDAAKKFKELNPRSYPINFNFNGVKVIFYAMHLEGDLDGPSQLYWDGEKFSFAGLQPQYRDGVEYLAMLYREGLIDPEYIIDNKDTIMTKLLNEDNYMVLNNWSSHTLEYTNAAEGEYLFVNGIMPYNPTYGKAWHQFNKDNAYSLTFWAYFVVNSTTAKPELMARFMDLQYSPEIYEIFSWGVEGVTYIWENGQKRFVDELKTAVDPVVKANEFGIRASGGRARSIFSFIADGEPWRLSFPVNDNTYFNGVLESAPMHMTKFFREASWPNEYTPAFWEARPELNFSTDETDEYSPILTQMKTFGTQMQANLIAGTIPISQFDAQMDEWRSTYDYQRVLDIYNAAAQRALLRN